MSSYRDDREWSDRFIPAIRRVVGPLLLEPAPLEMDCSEATDLIVMRARDIRIAARVRRPGYLKSYADQFTIRSRRDNGMTTELRKMIEGWGDWMLYGHANDSETDLATWMVIDLHAWRAAMIRRRNGSPATGEKPNGDGTWFRWYDVNTFPSDPPILVARG